MERRIAALIADFTRRVWQDSAKNPREASDEHTARCYVEGFINAMAKEGKTILIVDKTTGDSVELKQALKE